MNLDHVLFYTHEFAIWKRKIVRVSFRFADREMFNCFVLVLDQTMCDFDVSGCKEIKLQAFIFWTQLN